MTHKYQTLDITLLSARPQMRGVALDLAPQFAPAAWWERLILALRDFKGVKR